MLPSTVNDNARSLMGALKRWYNRDHPTITSGGAANVQTLTYTIPPTALVAGDIFSFTAGFTNTAATTLNNGLGAKNVFANGAALLGGEIVVGKSYMVFYDGTQYNLFAMSGLLPVNLGGTGKASWITGSIPFASVGTGTNRVLTEDNANLFFDDTNNRLGVGTASPNVTLDVRGNIDAGSVIRSGTGVSTGDASIELGGNRTGDGNSYIDFHSSVSDFDFRIIRAAGVNGAINVQNAGAGLMQVGTIGAGQLNFFTNNTVRLAIDSSGTSTFVGGIATQSLSSSGAIAGTTITASGAFSTTAQANKFGSAAGSYTSPTVNNTNVKLYENSSTNWSGIGSHTDGSMYFVTGISAPATRLLIDPSGAITAGGGITASGFNATGNFYNIGGVNMAQRVTNYHVFYDYVGNPALYLGASADPSNYYRNTTHYIQSINGGATFATINAAGITVPGTVTAGAMATGSIAVSGGGSSIFGAGTIQAAGGLIAGSSLSVGTSTTTSTLTATAGGTSIYANSGNVQAAGALIAGSTASVGTSLVVGTSITAGGQIQSTAGGTAILASNGDVVAAGNVSAGNQVSAAGLIFSTMGGTAINATNGDIVAVGNMYCTTLFYSGGQSGPSDRKLKKNIKPLTSQLAEINKLKPVSFVFKSRDGVRLGLIAQDVQETGFADLVSENKHDGKTALGMNYVELIAPLISAVQELSARLAKLEKAASK